LALDDLLEDGFFVTGFDGTGFFTAALAILDF
jgi:hypothetical protein